MPVSVTVGDRVGVGWREGSAGSPEGAGLVAGVDVGVPVDVDVGEIVTVGVAPADTASAPQPVSANVASPMTATAVTAARPPASTRIPDQTRALARTFPLRRNARATRPVQALVNTRATLWPPKPNELSMAATSPSDRVRCSPRTTSRGIAGS